MKPRRMNWPARRTAGVAVGICMMMLTACQTLQPPTAQGGHYALGQVSSVGLQDVYQTDDRTYLVFTYQVPEAVTVFDPEGRQLATARSGALIAVKGIYDRMVIRLGGAWAVVARKPGGVRSTQMPRAVWADFPLVTEQLNRQGDADNTDPRLKSTSDRSAGQITTAGQQGTTPGIRPRANLADGISEKLIRFEDDSVVPAPGTVIERIARKASDSPGYVVIRGEVPPRADMQALKQADAQAQKVKQLLVDAGVPGERTIITPVRQRWVEEGAVDRVISRETGSAGRVSVSFRPVTTTRAPARR